MRKNTVLHFFDAMTHTIRYLADTGFKDGDHITAVKKKGKVEFEKA